jgi:hypothetical protein
MTNNNDPHLSGHLERNSALWLEWLKEGVVETKELTVDFHFSAARERLAIALERVLVAEGFKVTITPKRTALIFKAWSVEASETALWSLERLQFRTRQLYDAASSVGMHLEGLGATMPSN